MPKMPEFGIPCIVPRLFQAGSDGEEKQSHQITVRNKILIKTPHPSRLAFSSKKSLSFLNFGGELKREILDIKQITKIQYLFTSLKTDFLKLSHPLNSLIFPEQFGEKPCISERVKGRI